MAETPDPLDLIGIDALLSDEERQIRDLARRWVVDRILPEVEDWYERGEFPARELATELGKLGFLGMQLPEIGGLGAVAYGLVELELEAGDSGLRSFVSVTSALGDVRDPLVRVRRAEGRVAPEAAVGRGDRVLRAERARQRERPELDADVREA